MKLLLYWLGAGIICVVLTLLFWQRGIEEVELVLADSQAYAGVGSATLPEVQAKSWLVFDVETGEQLLWHDPDTVRPIASVTKLITAVAWRTHTTLSATTSPTWSDLNTEGTAGRLEYGAVYSHRDLLYPLLLESSNDAAALMTRVEPDLLDLMNTYPGNYADGSGLSADNRASAVELSAAATQIWREQPHIFDITRLTAFYPEDSAWLNNSPFVSDEAYRGGKHGFTEVAGRTAVAIFAEELKGSTTHTLGYVLLDAEDITTDVAALRTYVRENVRYE